MTTFDERERAFEAHTAFEDTLDFKVQARRDRLVALWAGERMGLTAAELEPYVLDVVRADLREPGDHDVYQKVLADLTDRNIHLQPHELRERMDAFLVQARQELDAGK